jgi:hypothetical protein
MHVVCMATSADSGTARADHGECREPIYREKAPLREVLDVDGLLICQADVAGFSWLRGELAEHLRWGEFTRMAVTLMTADVVEALLPALEQGGSALEYRLQAGLARAYAVNLLALLREIDALAAFDEMFGRRHERDAEIDALRIERLARIRRMVGSWRVGRGMLARLLFSLAGRRRGVTRQDSVAPPDQPCHVIQSTENCVAGS